MPQIEQGMRQDIAVFLPDAMKTAIQSYIRFSEDEATIPDNEYTPKTFKEHHDACKVCIAHIELLIKLAKWADIPPPELEGELENAIMQSIIENAQAELKE